MRSGSTAAPAVRYPVLDLKAQYSTIREEVMEAIIRVMECQHFILGDEVRLFEEEVAEKLGARYAIGCASGSDALVLAMMAEGIGPGDEVITSPFTYVATAEAIARVGAKPVFVDIDSQTFNIDTSRIEAAIAAATRAVLPVHLFGLPADLDSILDVAKQHGLAVVEDTAQAIAARYKGRYAGTIGTFGCFSFFPSKNLGCAGDGGLLTTNDSALAERLRLLRVHGSKKKYHHEVLGVNSRLDALQAAILRVKLRHLDEWTGKRQTAAEQYRELFGAGNLAEFVKCPSAPADSVHVYNQFTLRCSKRDELREFLTAAGISTEIYYPIPLHLQPAFSYLGKIAGKFPEAERASSEVLSLPIYPELEREQQEFIAHKISLFYGRNS